MLQALRTFMSQVELASPEDESLLDDSKDWKWSVNTFSLLMNQVAGNINPHPANYESDCWMLNLDEEDAYPRVEVRVKKPDGKYKSKKRKAARLIFALFNPDKVADLIKYARG